MRLDGGTKQQLVRSLQDDQSKLSRQLTQLQLTVQEKDSRIQCVDLSCHVCPQTKCADMLV